MKRISITPRKNWENSVRQQGFVYYNDYYKEDSCYVFSKEEIENIEKATVEVFDMCCKTMDFLINTPHLLVDIFKIPSQFVPLIVNSWKQDDVALYGRFDLAYDGENIKVLEFNADTPTSLLEASVIQWYWLQEFDQTKDQFNSIHEKFVAHIENCKDYLNEKVFLASITGSEEDYMTTKYIEDCFNQAGVRTEYIHVEDICVNEDGDFCSNSGELIKSIFKLYPYEWMFHEEFSDNLAESLKKGNTWMEPVYKAVWSNKMFMYYLHKMFPNSPYVLKCQLTPEGMENYVVKPLLSREGANVTIFEGTDIIAQTGGEYGEEGFVYQEYFKIPKFEGKTPILGSWVVGGESAGMGIRESENLITNNMAQFISHMID
jgi:glutathionylspermidine synthase